MSAQNPLEGAVFIRYRISVSQPIMVASRLKHIFGNRTEVPKGDYEFTINSKQMNWEREVQEVVKTYKGVTATIRRTFLD